MKTKSIRWQLSLSYAGIAFLVTLLLGAIMMGMLGKVIKLNAMNLSPPYLYR